MGQNFLVSSRFANILVDAAGTARDDTVFEIGTGTGNITELIAQKANKVYSYELDQRLFSMAEKRLARFGNVHLFNGDAFVKPQCDKRFDVGVTSLPYSESLKFIEWLALRAGSFRSVTAILQSEFALKCGAECGNRNYRAVSVLAQSSFQIERLYHVPRECFSPVPRVDSEILRFTPRTGLDLPIFSREKILLLKQLFSFRGRLLASALRKIEDGKFLHEVPVSELRNRVEKLSIDEFVGIIRLSSE